VTISKRIKSLRSESGLRQSELGKAVGVSSQVISNIERGYTRPSTELVNRCAKYFGVPADYLLGRTTEKYSTTEQKEAPTLSAKIKDRMDQLQLNQSDLITKSEISEDSFEGIMAGTVIPGIDVAGRLSKALDTSIDYLIGNSAFSCAIASEDEQDIILKFRKMSKRGKRLFLAMMEELEEK
jgi:transcriptional regulator with XRE-family HTH domain